MIGLGTILTTLISGKTRAFLAHINGCILVKIIMVDFLSYLNGPYHYLHYHSPIVISMLLPDILLLRTR